MIEEKTPKGRICALCQQEKELKNSHIIPEFFYKPAYDEKHRFLQYSTNPADKISKPEQKGLREHLLCGDCEVKLSKWEDYVRRVIYGGVELEIAMEDTGATVKGVDYPKFKLFSMSLLWRASATKIPQFGDVELGPHEGKLRKMIQTEDPGKHYEYGCSIVFAPESDAQEIFSHVISPPERLEYGPHDMYRFMLGMTFWMFFVSDHMRDLKDTYFSLSEDGTLKFYNGGYPAMRYLSEVANALREANETRHK